MSDFVLVGLCFVVSFRLIISDAFRWCFLVCWFRILFIYFLIKKKKRILFIFSDLFLCVVVFFICGVNQMNLNLWGYEFVWWMTLLCFNFLFFLEYGDLKIAIVMIEVRVMWFFGMHTLLGMQYEEIKRLHEDCSMKCIEGGFVRMGLLVLI
jgi:hypothetical protein